MVSKDEDNVESGYNTYEVTKYVIKINRRDGYDDYQVMSAKKAAKMKYFVYNGHKYHLVTKDAFLWKFSPMKKIDWRSPIAMLHWFGLSRAKGLLIYNEPTVANWDYDTASEIAIEPLNGRLTELAKEGNIVEGATGQVVDPTDFRTLVVSPVYRRFINKTRFGTANIALYIVVAGLVVIAILLLTSGGKI